VPTVAGSNSAGGNHLVAGTAQAAGVDRSGTAGQQLRQNEVVQERSGESGGRLLLWLAIIAGLSSLLLSAFFFFQFRKKIQANTEKIERLKRNLDQYRFELQKQVAENSAKKPEAPPVASVAVSAPTAFTAPVAAPQAEAPEVEEPEVEAPEVEAPETPAAPSVQAPIVAQNSEISDKNEKVLKNESFEGGDSDDFERFKLMDQAVTERKLFLDADINRHQLMSLAGVDKNRFALMMRNCAHTNLAGYINAKRMEYALQFIKEHPDYTMKNIAEACGFSSQSTFFRVFKSFYGITPTELIQTGFLPKEEAELPFEDELPKSHYGQNENFGGNTISFKTPSEDAVDQ